MADSRDAYARRATISGRIGCGQQLKQFRIVHDFRMLRVGQPIFHRGEAFIFHIIGGHACLPRLRGKFHGKYARAEAFLVRILRIHHKPRRGFVAARNVLQVFLQR